MHQKQPYIHSLLFLLPVHYGIIKFLEKLEKLNKLRFLLKTFYNKIYLYIYCRSFQFLPKSNPIENSALDGINANGKLVFLSFLLLLLLFFPLSLSLSWPYNTFRDRFGSSVKSRTFRDVVTKLRALQLQTPNSPYDPALFRKPQSLYSWDDRATRFCGTSAPTGEDTPRQNCISYVAGRDSLDFEDNGKLLISYPVLSPSPLL